MPATYWLPLPDLKGPSAVEHLHAALSAWFDTPAEAGEAERHHDNVKPYTISPTSCRENVWGVQISVLTAGAEDTLLTRADEGSQLRLGHARTRIGDPSLLAASPWPDLAQHDGSTAWAVQFLTPAAFRTGSRTSPFPTPAVVLRSPTEAWRCFSGLPEVRISPVEQAELWVSRIDVETVMFTLKGRDYPGILGSVTFRCGRPEVAAKASALLRLAAFCGVGSFRGKGMGVVAVGSR